jgi:hypothetical protein
VKIQRFSGAAILVVLFCLPGYSDERFQASIHFSSGFPQREFNQNINSAGLGGSGYFAYRFKNSPFSAGFSIGALVYGSETRPELWDANIPEVKVNVITRNYILLCHLVFRVQPPEGKFRPYAEGLAGFHYLWTETGIYNRGAFPDRIASSVNHSDWAWSLGAGCGVSVILYEKMKHRGRNPFVILVDLGARFIKGGKAEYLREGSIHRDGERLIYDIQMSTTDLITAQLGVSFAF